MRIVQSLNQDWKFTKRTLPIPERFPDGDPWEDVNLPHTWNGTDGQDGGGDYHRGTCLYVKELCSSLLPSADRYYLEFKGANSSADVYVNGIFAAHHDGGYSTWRTEVTRMMKAPDRDTALLAVAVDNAPNDHVYPQQADFTFYGGLYRDVNLIAVSDSHFDLLHDGTPGIKVTPYLASDTAADAQIEIEVRICGAQAGQTLRFEILDKDGVPAAQQTVPVSEEKASIKLENVHRWNGKKDPYLYTAKVSLFSAGGSKLDQVSTRFGCRTFSVDPDKGFFLNGVSCPLHGVSRHQDRPGIGNALSAAHHKEDIDLILEMGANTVRLAHYQHDQAFYDLCDETGLIVWAEIPYISMHLPEGRKNTISQMRELITQNYNHPSIIVWGLSNEITVGGTTDDLLENHRILNDLAHQLDPTRRTVAAAVSSCDIHDPYLNIPDLVSYNLYYGWYDGTAAMNGPWLDDFHAQFPDRLLGLSEYGCEALNWHSSEPKKGDYTEEYQALYHEEMIRQLFSRPYLWSTYVWNMFDFAADARNEGGCKGMNNKGLVTFDRKYRKDAFYAYKAWLSDEPFVHICGKRYADRTEEVTKVTVYSNLPVIELFVNGERLGSARTEDHFFRFVVPNTGETVLTAQGVSEDGVTVADTGHLRKVAVFNEAYRLKEQGPVLNWFDIIQPDGFCSVNDTLDEIMATEEGAAYVHDMLVRLMGERAEVMIASPTFSMIRTFTVMRIFQTPRILGGEDKVPTRDVMLQINAELNTIPKAR